MGTKRVCCYSGGHSSAICAIEVGRRYGTDDLILVNHDIHPSVEDADIKRFKREVAAYIGVPVTQVDMPGVESMDQFDVVMKEKAFKVGSGTALCTARLKTEPFMRWLREEFPGGDHDCVIYYGFDAGETARIQRRSSILAAQGYRSDYPLALWPEAQRTIHSTAEVGIDPPLTYSVFRHGNCKGCLKAGKQHWYVIFCHYPAIWARAKFAEEVIGYSILKGAFLEELEPEFERMKAAGVPATEKIAPGAFWATARRMTRLNVVQDEGAALPCECTY